MATTLSAEVTALARQVALDQIAQDIDFNAKVNAKADTSVVTALQQTVSGQAAQIAANGTAAQNAQTAADTAQSSVSTLQQEIIAICQEISRS